MKPIIHIKLIPFLAFLISVSIFAQEPYLNSNPEEVLGSIEMAFQEKSLTILNKTCSPSFATSAKFEILKNYMDSNSIQLAYREELAEQVFFLEDRIEKLVVQLLRNKNRSWSVQDAFYINNRKKVAIEKAIFSPLSYADHFYDLARAIRNKDLNYLSLAPNGKLNYSTIDSLQLKLSSQTSITYKNLIIYNGKELKDFIYIKLKDFPCDNNEKCGWLIEEIGLMEEFYKHDPFIQFLLQKSTIDLEAPSKLNKSIELLPYTPSKPELESLLEGTYQEDKEEIYIIKPGDTLSEIAYNYGIELGVLMKFNNLTSTQIQPKQTLNIPFK